MALSHSSVEEYKTLLQQYQERPRVATLVCNRTTFGLDVFLSFRSSLHARLLVLYGFRFKHDPALLSAILLVSHPLGQQLAWLATGLVISSVQ